MLYRKLIVCTAILLPASVLAGLTVKAQEPFQTATTQSATQVFSPPPSSAQGFDSPFDNRSMSNQTQLIESLALGGGWRTGNVSLVQKAFASLKEAETDADKSNAKTKLREALVNEYDSKMDQYDGHIESLEKELEQMRDRLSRRRAAKEEMVDLKLQEMLANADGLGWPSSPSRNRRFFQNAPSPVRGFGPARTQEVQALPTAKLN